MGVASDVLAGPPGSPKSGPGMGIREKKRGEEGRGRKGKKRKR